MRRRAPSVLAAVLALVTAAAAGPLDVTLDRYAAARHTGALGAAEGRAYAELPRPRDPDRPLTGTAVTLLPRSDAFLARLDEIKRGARDSNAEIGRAHV